MIVFDLLVAGDTAHLAEFTLAVWQLLNVVVTIGTGQCTVHALREGLGSDKQGFLCSLPVLPGRDTKTLDTMAFLALGILERPSPT